jgi:hypothetical protein
MQARGNGRARPGVRTRSPSCRRDPPGLPGAVSFHDTGRPSSEAIERVARRTRDGMVRWLRRKGLLDERGANVCLYDRQEPSALEACAEAALRQGAFGRVGEDGTLREDEDGRFPPRRPGAMTADVEGFNVQAAVRVEADDDVGREQLVRYCARPCFALESEGPTSHPPPSAGTGPCRRFGGGPTAAVRAAQALGRGAASWESGGWDGRPRTGAGREQAGRSRSRPGAGDVES